MSSPVKDRRRTGFLPYLSANKPKKIATRRPVIALALVNSGDIHEHEYVGRVLLLVDTAVVRTKFCFSKV